MARRLFVDRKLRRHAQRGHGDHAADGGAAFPEAVDIPPQGVPRRHAIERHEHQKDRVRMTRQNNERGDDAQRERDAPGGICPPAFRQRHERCDQKE